MKIMSKKGEASNVDDVKFFNIYKEIENDISWKKDIVMLLIFSVIIGYGLYYLGKV